MTTSIFHISYYCGRFIKYPNGARVLYIVAYQNNGFKERYYIHAN